MDFLLATMLCAELLVMFVSGFLLATGSMVLPAETGPSRALRVQESGLQAKESALVNCVAAKDQCNELKDKIQAENGEINAKLKEALLGCYTPDAQEKPKGNNP